MIALGYKTTQIASLLGVSRPTVYRMMHDANINPVARYTDISEHELDRKLSNIKTDHPNIGEIMTAGHLRAQGIKVKRSDLRSSLRRVFTIVSMIILVQIMCGILMEPQVSSLGVRNSCGHRWI